MNPSTKWITASPFDLTHWFSANKFNPGTPGVYERKMNAGNTHYSYWTGEYWWAYSASITGALHNYKKKWKSNYQNLPFRGLKHEACSSDVGVQTLFKLSNPQSDTHYILLSHRGSA